MKSRNTNFRETWLTESDMRRRGAPIDAEPPGNGARFVGMAVLAVLVAAIVGAVVIGRIVMAWIG